MRRVDIVLRGPTYRPAWLLASRLFTSDFGECVPGAFVVWIEAKRSFKLSTCFAQPFGLVKGSTKSKRSATGFRIVGGIRCQQRNCRGSVAHLQDLVADNLHRFVAVCLRIIAAKFAVTPHYCV